MNVGVRVDRKLDHATIVLSGPFDLAHSNEVVHAVHSAEAHLQGCHWPTSAWRRSIESTGAAQPYWRGYSIVWPQMGAGPTSRKATTPRRLEYWRYIAGIEPITPLFRHAP